MELPKVIKHLEINIYQYSNTIMVRLSLEQRWERELLRLV